MTMNDAETREREDETRIKVEDRRRFRADGDAEAHEAHDEVARDEEALETIPSADLAAAKERAETAERKLSEYAAAFQSFRAEQDRVRARLERDVERKVELRFGSLVADLLDAVDDLDRALDHAPDSGDATALAEGVAMVRDRFLAGLQRSGVERFDPAGSEFDPNVAEAVAVVGVDDASLDGKVVDVLRPGYRLGERVIRPARVSVGRLSD